MVQPHDLTIQGGAFGRPLPLTNRKAGCAGKGVPMEERLQHIAASVSDWVKFAESKNAAIVAFDGVMLFGLVNMLKGLTPPLGGAVRLGVYCTVALLLLALSFALCSFIPNLRMPFLSVRRPCHAQDNLVYYGDIAKYDSDTYLALLCQHMEVDVKALHAMERYYAQQIVESAGIAQQKYRIFAGAVSLTILALLLACISGTLYLMP